MEKCRFYVESRTSSNRISTHEEKVHPLLFNLSELKESVKWAESRLIAANQNFKYFNDCETFLNSSNFIPYYVRKTIEKARDTIGFTFLEQNADQRKETHLKEIAYYKVVYDTNNQHLQDFLEQNPQLK